MVRWWPILVGILALILVMLWVSRPNPYESGFPTMLGVNSSHV
jgi:hypothetical protein